ncbi:O-antigen ligase family protein [Natrarchaeobius halalkaliphilus]|uniref:O-antigen ligase family protein n=1 Tax=Natrarchaeobius halalkaliphilus TaxID=1679091 RepID=UPI000F5283ED|nr:O-antigen ligase family protein [Natrarchaeobius halalkaliphilus]
MNVLILGTVFGICMLWSSRHDEYIELPRFIFLPLLAIWAFFIISSVTVSPTISQSVLQTVAAIAISGTAIFIIPKVYSSGSFLFHIFLISFVLGLFSVLALILPLESIGPVELLRAVPYEEYVIFGEARYGEVPIAGLENPNQLSVVLLPGVLAGVSYLRTAVSKKPMSEIVISGIALLFPLISLILTRSRGGFIALIVGVVTFIAIHHFSTTIVRIFCLSGIIGSLLVLAPTGIGPVPSLIELVSEPRAWRWKHAIDSMQKQPFLGYGPGNSRLATQSGTQPHNAYYMLGLWGGLGPFILYLYMFARILLVSVRDRVNTMPAVFPAILTSYWIYSLFESVTIFHFTAPSVILVVTFGFVAHSFVTD